MSYKSNRRQFLVRAVQVGAALSVSGLSAAASNENIAVQANVKKFSRVLNLRNIHTGERISAKYFDGDDYDVEGLSQVYTLLRDHRANKIGQMDFKLIDLLHKIDFVTAQSGRRKNRPIDIISGYRSPETNAMLRKRSSGVAKNSLHMQGKAVDIRVPGYSTSDLFNICQSLKLGGVGRYVKSGFVHLDVGRVRYWG